MSSKISLLNPSSATASASASASEPPANGVKNIFITYPLTPSQAQRFENIFHRRVAIFHEYLHGRLINGMPRGLTNKHNIPFESFVIQGSIFFDILDGVKKAKDVDIQFAAAHQSQEDWIGMYSAKKIGTIEKINEWIRDGLIQFSGDKVESCVSDNQAQYFNMTITHKDLPVERYLRTDLSLTFPSGDTPESTCSYDALRCTLTPLSALDLHQHPEYFQEMQLHVEGNRYPIEETLRLMGLKHYMLDVAHARKTHNGLLRITALNTEGVFKDVASQAVDDALVEALIEQNKHNLPDLSRKINNLIKKKYAEDKRAALIYLLNLEHYFKKSKADGVAPFIKVINRIICEQLGILNLSPEEEMKVGQFCRNYLTQEAQEMETPDGKEYRVYGKLALLSSVEGSMEGSEELLRNSSLCTALEQLFPPTSLKWKKKRLKALSKKQPPPKLEKKEEEPSVSKITPEDKANDALRLEAYDDCFDIYVAEGNEKLLLKLQNELLKYKNDPKYYPGIASLLNRLNSHYAQSQNVMQKKIIEGIYKRFFEALPQDRSFSFFNMINGSLENFAPATLFNIFSTLVINTDPSQLSHVDTAKFQKAINYWLIFLKGKPIGIDPPLGEMANRFKKMGPYVRNEALNFLKQLPAETKGTPRAILALESNPFSLKKKMENKNDIFGFLKYLSDLKARLPSEKERQLIEKRLREVQIWAVKNDFKTSFSDDFEIILENLLDLMLNLEDPDLYPQIFASIFKVHYLLLQKSGEYHKIQPALQRLLDKGKDIEDLPASLFTFVLPLIAQELISSDNVKLFDLLISPFFKSRIELLARSDQSEIYLAILNMCAQIRSKRDIEDVIQEVGKKLNFPEEANHKWFKSLPLARQKGVIDILIDLRLIEPDLQLIGFKASEERKQEAAK